jgi:alkylhydroperoxidase family enzyme
LTSFAANLQVTLSQMPASASAGTSADWANASKHYDDDQLAALVSLIALINTWNRMNVITQQPAGGYQPGQFG